MIQKLKTSIVILSLIAGLYTVLVPWAAQAAPITPGPCKSGYAHPLDDKGDPLASCSKIITSKEAKTLCPSGFVDDKDKTKCLPLGSNPAALKDNPIVKDLNVIVNVLAGLVGIAIVGAIIFGGIQ